MATNETVRQIRDHAVQFRLACLNQAVRQGLFAGRERGDASGSTRPRTAEHGSIGLGIRWQRAVAAEHMAADKDAEPEDHERWLAGSPSATRAK